MTDKNKGWHFFIPVRCFNSWRTQYWQHHCTDGKLKIKPYTRLVWPTWYKEDKSSQLWHELCYTPIAVSIQQVSGRGGGDWKSFGLGTIYFEILKGTSPWLCIHGTAIFLNSVDSYDDRFFFIDLVTVNNNKMWIKYIFFSRCASNIA